MTQIVSAESKAAFKNFVSKLNQIETSVPDQKTPDISPEIVTEGFDINSYKTPDFVETRKDRIAVNVDKSMLGIFERLNKVTDYSIRAKIETEDNVLTETLPTKTSLNNSPQQVHKNKTKLFESSPAEMSLWEIEKNTDGRYITYNIKDAVDGRYILENVNLHKIAVKIVSLLENGYYINDKDVTRLLRLDEDFSFYYNESVEAKEKYIKTKKDLHEHRFHYAKGQVDLLEKQIVRECL